MILFLLLLIAALAVVGVYAAQNTGTQDITVLNMQFHSVANWLPVVAAAAVVALLFILYMLYSGAVHGARTGALRRRISTHESALADLNKENQRLREENARMRSEMRGVNRGTGRRWCAREKSPSTTRLASAITQRRGKAIRDYSDRCSRSQSDCGPLPSPSERGRGVRSFFSGREPAGY